METINLKDRPEIKAVILKGSQYRKHKALYCVTDSVTPYGTYWDGGSRSSYFHVTANGQVKSVPQPSAPPQFGGGDPEPFAIPAGDYVVKVGTFCGKTATAVVYHNI